MLEPTESTTCCTVRDRLLNAAEQLVSRQGVANLTLEAVAREAGVSKGGLLYHFPSKTSLITGIMQRQVCRLRKDQLEAVAQQPPGPGAFTRAYLGLRQKPPPPEEVSLHAALLAAVGTDPQFLEPIREISAEWQRRLESDGIDPALAHIVRLVMDGLCFCRLLGLAVPQDDLHQRVVEILSAMARPKKDSDKPSEA